MATVNLGKIKLVNRGTWSSSTTYTADDIVQYTDTGNNILSTYICVVSSSQGHTPSSNGTTHASWDFLVEGVEEGGGLQSMNVFNTSGSHTWTKPSGTKRVKVFVTGGGGGGMSGPSNDNPGSSGGGGGTAIKVIDVTSISSVSVTVGAGGAGNSTSSGVRYGNGGGTSSFGSHCSATGGGAGYAGNDSRYGGIGGVGSGGDLNLHGDSGTSEGNDGTNNPNPPASPAGASFWGGLGMYGANNAGLTQANMNGYHGSAGGNMFAGSGAGNGGDGLVVVENYK